MTVAAFEQQLGHKFNNPALLQQALTHRSFGAGNNERLEFLGDGILNCCIANLIFEQFPAMPEGELSRLRANLVNQSVLAEISGTLGIGSLLRLGDGELKTGGAHRPSILGDGLEAVLGAVFLDAGFAAAATVVRHLFATRLSNVRDTKPSKDAKTELQEWLQAKHLPLPSYTVKRIEGEAHRQQFHVECAVKAFEIQIEGTGASRRLAEQAAAVKVLSALASRGPESTKRGH